MYKGLENKIIDLQQKLTESKSMNKELKKSMVGHENLVKEMENLKIAEVKENVFIILFSTIIPSKSNNKSCLSELTFCEVSWKAKWKIC